MPIESEIIKICVQDALRELLWKHLIFNQQPAYITRRSNVSITALTALRARCRGLVVIKCLINTRRLCSYPILIKQTALELARYSTKSILTHSVSLSSMCLIVLNYLLLDATRLRDFLNKTQQYIRLSRSLQRLIKLL